jgi:signal transduction histidine kinase
MTMSKRISLREWFRRRTSGRLIGGNLIVVVVSILLIAVISREDIASRQAAIDDLTQVAPRAITQQNRPMVEAILLSFGRRVRAESLGICQKDREILSMTVGGNYCATGKLSAPWLSITRQIELPGLSDYRVYFVVPWLPHLPLIALVMLAASLMIILNMILMRQVSSILWRELIEPLHGAKLEEVRIAEVHDLLAAKERAVAGDAIRRLSLQVAHDIRSPLSALKVLSQSATELKQAQRELLIGVATRINRIAEDLLRQDSRESGIVPMDVRGALIAIIDEKRLQLEGSDLELKTEFHHESLFGLGLTEDFKRVISNLVNNSIEASNSKGQIKIITSVDEKFISIVIQDQGNGIVPSILAQLGRRQITTKARGHGLGISSAVALIRSWGGELTFDSTVGHGTKAKLQLIKAEI